jgi:hypothetical protein
MDGFSSFTKVSTIDDSRYQLFLKLWSIAPMPEFAAETAASPPDYLPQRPGAFPVLFGFKPVCMLCTEGAALGLHARTFPMA